MEANDTLRAYAEKKADKIKKFLAQPIDIHFILTNESGTYKTEITLLADHLRAVAEGTGGDGQISVDQAMSKLEAQLRKHKDKQKNHKHPRPEKE